MGSITVDEDLLDASGILPNEKVQIVNVNNGERFETYIIKGERGSGQICLNGPAARKVQLGDILIVIAYGMMTLEEAKNFTPQVVYVDENNRHVKN
jgi:aspartate 1-decarboxylase